MGGTGTGPPAAKVRRLELESLESPVELMRLRQLLIQVANISDDDGLPSDVAGVELIMVLFWIRR